MKKKNTICYFKTVNNKCYKSVFIHFLLNDLVSRLVNDGGP